MCMDVVAWNKSAQPHLDPSGSLAHDHAGMVRKRISPPLAMLPDIMRTSLHDLDEYVTGIAFTRLDQYVDISYTDQDSMFPKKILRAACMWFSSGRYNHTEIPSEYKQIWDFQMLQKAIEVHILTFILGGNLFLSPHSSKMLRGFLEKDFGHRAVPRLASRQIKCIAVEASRSRLISLLRDWDNTNSHAAYPEDDWATELCVLLILILVADMVAGSAFYFREGRIRYHQFDAKSERTKFGEFTNVSDKYTFEYLRERFHSRYGTRRGGKDSFNPVRDGMSSWRGANRPDARTRRLIEDLINIKKEFGMLQHIPTNGRGLIYLR